MDNRLFFDIRIPPSIMNAALPYTFKIADGPLHRYKDRTRAMKAIRSIFKESHIEPLLLAMGEVKLYHHGEREELTEKDIQFILGDTDA